MAERLGLSDALGRTNADGTPLLGDLAVRIAALTAFWLSDDYARLRDAIKPPTTSPAAASTTAP